jgi:hypothetical protein
MKTKIVREDKDVKIDMETDLINDYNNLVDYSSGVLGRVDGESKIKLKELITYTEEEVKILLHKYENDMIYYGRDCYYSNCFPQVTNDWFEQNKKK